MQHLLLPLLYKEIQDVMEGDLSILSGFILAFSVISFNFKNCYILNSFRFRIGQFSISQYGLLFHWDINSNIKKLGL